MIYNDVRFDEPKHLYNTPIKKETENGYEFELSFPGCAKENIELSIKENLIFVNAKVNYAAPEGYSPIVTEFNFKEKYIPIEIPAKADDEKISAKYNNGILTISIPKKEVEKKIITIS